MNNKIKATIQVILTTSLTGITCYWSGMTIPDLKVAIIVTAVVSGTVAYGAAFISARRVQKDYNVV